MRSLDEQVQEVKSDVLAIAAELRQLEERLLFPSNTQVSVFVALAENEQIRLDSVEIAIDGQPATHHIYSFKELDALRSGGVQRVFTGNVTTGNHAMQVTVRGELPGGGPYTGTASHGFEKGVEPAIVGITLTGSGSDGSRIAFEAR